MKKIFVNGKFICLIDQQGEETLRLIFPFPDTSVVIAKKIAGFSLFLRDTGEGSPVMVDILKKKIWMIGYEGVSYEEIEE